MINAIIRTYAYLFFHFGLLGILGLAIGVLAHLDWLFSIGKWSITLGFGGWLLLVLFSTVLDTHLKKMRRANEVMKMTGEIQKEGAD